jgi:CubicO group peptidase (beta-lactamase class C family)
MVTGVGDLRAQWAGHRPMSPEARRAEVERILESARESSGVPSLAAAIVTRDGLWAVGAVGSRRSDERVPVTVDDVYHLGSDTKAITAGLLGLLVDEGRLEWSATLAALLPELAARMRPEYRTVTLRELLSHQGGLVANAGIAFGQATPRAQRAAYVKWVLAQRPASARGKFAYSNANYVVAGAIAERLYDAPYEKLVVEKLLAPLGVTTVGFGAAGTPGKVDQPWPHRVNAAGRRVPIPPGPGADNPPVLSPAGRMHMSMPDWALWTRAVLRGAVGLPSPWSPATGKTLVTPLVRINSRESYAMGWLTTQRSWAGRSRRVLTHAGSNGKNWAVAWLAPDAGFGVLVASNDGTEAASRAADRVAVRLARFYRRDTAVRTR